MSALEAVEAVAAPQAWLATNGAKLAAYAIGAALLVGVGFAAGWHVQGWRLNAEVADLKTKAAETRAAGAEAGLADLTKASADIAAAAKRYGASQSDLGSKIDQILSEMKNAKPLPADCRPDDFRVRQLDAAIRAAAEAAAGQPAR